MICSLSGLRMTAEQVTGNLVAGSRAFIGVIGAFSTLAGCDSSVTPTGTVASAAPTIVGDPAWAFGGFQVFFDFDSADVNAAGQAELDLALRETAKIWDVRGIHWSVTGHADRAGSENYNMALSLRRANAVRQALIARGVSPDSITVAGRGESEPTVPTADSVKEQANRRVMIIPQ
jgi:OOP family OmpA-OmpF porin